MITHIIITRKGSKRKKKVIMTIPSIRTTWFRDGAQISLPLDSLRDIQMSLWTMAVDTIIIIMTGRIKNRNTDAEMYSMPHLPFISVAHVGTIRPFSFLSCSNVTMSSKGLQEVLHFNLGIQDGQILYDTYCKIICRETLLVELEALTGYLIHPHLIDVYFVSFPGTTKSRASLLHALIFRVQMWLMTQINGAIQSRVEGAKACLGRRPSKCASLMAP